MIKEVSSIFFWQAGFYESGTFVFLKGFSSILEKSEGALIWILQVTRNSGKLFDFLGQSLSVKFHRPKKKIFVK